MASPASTIAAAASSSSSYEWGPLTALQALFIAEEQFEDGDKDRKQTDLALARQLASDDLQGAIKAASVEQLDLALAHDALAIERKPHSLLLLLSAKALKMEQWRMRRVVPEMRAAFTAASARFVWQISQFLLQVPVSLASKEISRVSALCTQYSAAAAELNQSVKAIYPLKAFLRRFYQHGHTELTPLHGQFFYLCLHAKCYSAAMEILNQPLFEIHAQANLVSAVDFVSYAYYGGMLYVGQKRFQDAIDLFTLAITAPAVSLSVFVIEAYKKLVLASLILAGEPPALPKYTPFVVMRHVEMHCSAYLELSKAFKGTKDVHVCTEIAQKHAAVFVKDGNFGLVKQTLEALRQRKLLQLTRTYVTIALAELTTAAGWSEGEAVAAEKTLLELVAKGQLRAVVDKHRAMVKFVLDGDDDDAGDGVESAAAASNTMRQLQREMQKLLLVSSQLRAMDAEIITSAKFQSRLQKDKDRRRGGNQQGDDSARMPLGAGGMDIFD